MPPVKEPVVSFVQVLWTGLRVTFVVVQMEYALLAVPVKFSRKPDPAPRYVSEVKCGAMASVNVTVELWAVVPTGFVAMT